MTRCHWLQLCHSTACVSQLTICMNCATWNLRSLTEFDRFRCEDDPAAIALLPLAAACDLPEPPPPPPPPTPGSGSFHQTTRVHSPYRPTAMAVSASSPEQHSAWPTPKSLDSSFNSSSTSTGGRAPRRASSMPKSRPYSTELSRHRARNAKGYRRNMPLHPRSTVVILSDASRCAWLYPHTASNLS